MNALHAHMYCLCSICTEDLIYMYQVKLHEIARMKKSCILNAQEAHTELFRTSCLDELTVEYTILIASQSHIQSERATNNLPLPFFFCFCSSIFRIETTCCKSTVTIQLNETIEYTSCCLVI